MKQNGARRQPIRLAKVERNARNTMDGIDMLRSLKDGEAKAVFLDPQYRAMLDKMKYGNEGETRERERGALPQMTDETICRFTVAIERVLAPSGHLFLWADKFTVGSGRHVAYVDNTTLSIVDLIHWNKIRPGMGRRARCVSEYLVVAQAPPKRAKGVWIDHRLVDSHLEPADRSLHPHAKPYQLIERLIRCVTKSGDVVVDPCAGSYLVLEACRATGRQFVGCDLVS